MDERAGGAVADAIGQRRQRRAQQFVAGDDGAEQVRGVAAVGGDVAFVAQSRQQREDGVVGEPAPALAQRGADVAHGGRAGGPQHLEHFQFGVTHRTALRHGSDLSSYAV